MKLTPGDHVTDRRCIREGIEAWIAWSLTRKETT